MGMREGFSEKKGEKGITFEMKIKRLSNKKSIYTTYSHTCIYMHMHQYTHIHTLAHQKKKPVH